MSDEVGDKMGDKVGNIMGQVWAIKLGDEVPRSIF